MRFSLGLIAILMSVASAEPSLWERLGGEGPIRPWLDSVVDFHFDDPLTAPYFGYHKFENNGSRKYVKEQVVHFFSAGTGGPYEYTGKDMVKAHSKMKITNSAFHALAYHAISKMEQFNVGTPAERDEVLGILYSLKNDVVGKDSNSKALPGPYVRNSWDIVSLLHYTLTEVLPTYLRSLPIPRKFENISNLSLAELYTLLPVVLVILSPLILLQLVKKIGESHNLNKNNSGIFQFSNVFYSGEGIIPALPYTLGLVPSFLALLATYLGGTYSWLVAVVGYILVPIADLFLGEDSYNATNDQEKKLKKNVWFRVITWAYVPLYLATIAYGVQKIALNAETIAISEFLGISISVGIAGGFGIGCVHELIHRPTWQELGLGIVSCVFANYSHFWIEHLWGHHKRVATDLDPASSNIGDNIYTFWPRCIYRSIVSALNIESRYLERNNLSLLSHRILQGYLASSAIAFGIYSSFGALALKFYLLQGVVVALHIENANFIEHYGLRRRLVKGKLDSDGEPVYERPGWFHAWDTADRLTNYMLFKIQRHPDHHTNAGRPYQILRTVSHSPTMPTGYAGMFVLSWFPPLFWAIMDPLVERAYEQRATMEARGIAASAFPRGSNNISSFFKREGEGFFVEGSSPYDDKNFYGSDVKKPKTVWNVDYDKEFHEGSKTGSVVESYTLETKKSK